MMQTTEQIQRELEAAQIRLGLAWVRAINTLATQLEDAVEAKENETPIDAEAIEIEETPEIEEVSGAKFKVGDRVTCTVCGEGTVLEVEDRYGEFKYSIDGMGSHWEYSLQLAEPVEQPRPEAKFTKGQWVKSIFGTRARVLESSWNADYETHQYSIEYLDGSTANRFESLLKPSAMPAPRFNVGALIRYDAWNGWTDGTVTGVELDADNDIEYTLKLEDGSEETVYDYDFGTDHAEDLVARED